MSVDKDQWKVDKQSNITMMYDTAAHSVVSELPLAKTEQMRTKGSKNYMWYLPFHVYKTTSSHR